MAGEFSTAYESGLTVYSLVFVSTDGTAWNGAAFVDPAGVAWAGCATAMTDDGAGTYSGTIPAGVPRGTYLAQAYLQLSDGPADTDPVIGTGLVFAAGSGFAPTPDPTRSTPTEAIL